ncbi:MAG: hypothetical protein ABI723_26785 [Bacteroidia bacterium]
MKINSNATFLIFLSIIVVAFSSCKIQNIEYRRFEKLSLTGISSAPSINLDLVFYNPNTIGCKIKEMGCFIINGNDTFAIASCSANSIRLKPLSEFSIPVSSFVSPQSLINLTTKSLFSNADIPFNFSGTITIQKFIFKKKYRFNVTEKFNRKQLFN